jgi:DUF4097 and DUF4098 domain-containing protein YvlB|uniref:DUF4097 domain-containing protein n=1 Tax=Mesoaciditoga lauensis TaxID=1495039 RepID=A0A7V3RE48_9BACT
MKEVKKFEWDATGIDKILVHSISTDIVVESSAERKIFLEMELSGFKKDVEEYKPKVRSISGKLEVDLAPHTPFLPDGFFAFGFMRFGVFSIQKVHLKIPANLSLGIETTSGDTVIKALSFNELRLSSVSGDFIINSKEMKNLSVKTISGNIDIENISSKSDGMDLQSVSGDIRSKITSFNRGNVKSTSGEIELMNVDPDFESLDVKTVSGDFSISFTSKPTVHVEIETVSGDVESDVNIMIGKLSHGAFDVGEEPSSTLKFKSISGDATFKFGSKTDEDGKVHSKADERLKTFEEILKSKRATEEEIRELMVTVGYKDEEIDEFLRTGKNNG